MHFVQLEVFEAPGAYLQWTKSWLYYQLFKVYQYESLPGLVAPTDLLILSGGSQSRGRGLPGRTIDRRSFGGSASSEPEKGIGVFPIQLTKLALKTKRHTILVPL